MIRRKGKFYGKLDFDDAAKRKMDSGMRWLLTSSETEIRRKYVNYKRKVYRKKKLAGLSVRALSSKANLTERKAHLLMRRKSLKELIPPRHLIGVVPGSFRFLRIRAIIRFTGNRSDLEDMGIKVRTQAQDIFTVVGTKKQLAELVSKASCQRMRTPRMLFPSAEEACGQAEIDAIHAARAANPTGFRGNGVLVGIIDSPLDVTHHGFREDTGTHDSRVLYYWAQSTHTEDAWGDTVNQAAPPGQTPDQFTNGAAVGTRPNFNGLNYGRIYTQDFINTAIGLVNTYGTANNQICCEPTRTDEHGTHCAGIAAGSGHVTNWATNPDHIGAAPEATIIHVRIQRLAVDLDTGGTFEDALLDGINFCLSAAQFHNMPIVLSVSQGSNFGPHNGSSDFDLARDNLINSFNNRSVVWAAGNDNDNDGYRKGTVASGNSTDNFTMTVERSGWGGTIITTAVWLDIWYSGPELEYRISYAGNNSGWRTSGQDYTGTINSRDIEAERDIESGGNLKGIRVYIDNARTNEIYTFELRNPHGSHTVNYHAWSGLQGWWASLSGATHDEATLGDTACGRSILTVGASDKVVPPNPATGEDITRYSGAGPTIDGRIKPEIVAVGGTADDPLVAGSQYDPIWSAASNQNNGYTDMVGTSMATPVVAGAIACLLEEYNSAPPIGLGLELNQDTVKALLIQYANRTNLNLDPTLPGYNQQEHNLYGYGRLRMIGPVDHILPPVDNDLWIRTAGDDYGEVPYPGGCFCHAPDIRVFQSGTNNETYDISWGNTYDVRIRVRNLGEQDAVNATVRLKYALPHTAPNDWFLAEGAANNKLENTSVSIPAMDSTEVVFSWRPQASELGAPAGTSHFCLLAEVDHINDPLTFTAAATGGGGAWTTNIKGTNNVALRNLHIQ